MEPVLGERAVARGGGEVHRRPGGAQRILEALAPFGERRLAQIVVAVREEVPRYERCRRLLGQQLHARGGRMDAQEERFEVEPRGADDDDLAVDDAALRQVGEQRLDELGEVAVQRLEVAALQQELVAVAKDQRAEAVPLRLELPAVALRQAVGGGGEHRLDRRVEGKAHRLGRTSYNRSGRGAQGRWRSREYTSRGKRTPAVRSSNVMRSSMKYVVTILL